MKTSTSTLNEKNRINCRDNQVYCVTNNDCLQLCSHAIDHELLTEYKCNEMKFCSQSILTDDKEKPDIDCKKEFGFYPVLTADEIFEPHWICLNTLPHLFGDNQEYHSYICAGGDRTKLDPKKIFESCECQGDKIKVRDSFRSDIPICVEKNQLSLFPNFSIET